MSDALQLYLALKAETKDKRFTAYANRAVRYLFEAVGDKHLPDFTRADANTLRDFLIKKGLVNTSVKRNFEVVRAIFNLAEREHALDIKNPFANILLINIKAGSVRPPLKPEEVHRLQTLCRKHDDEMRWLIALLSDTGIRLSEACGLLISDISLTADVPFISIQPHHWRSLKQHLANGLLLLSARHSGLLIELYPMHQVSLRFRDIALLRDTKPIALAMR